MENLSKIPKQDTKGYWIEHAYQVGDELKCYNFFYTNVVEAIVLKSEDSPLRVL